jgi:hypothetical protein
MGILNWCLVLSQFLASGPGPGNSSKCYSYYNFTVLYLIVIVTVALRAIAYSIGIGFAVGLYCMAAVLGYAWDTCSGHGRRPGMTRTGTTLLGWNRNL